MLFTKIENTLHKLDVNAVSTERKRVLQPLVDFVQNKVTHHKEIRLNFICTHNSRRSHLSQVWAHAIAAYLGIKTVSCYSGGTEATALFPMAATTLEDSGFRVKRLSEGDNPIYSIEYGEDAHPIIGFSKTYDDDFNPTSNYAAIMTCSQADAGCPFIAGAEKRIAITYEDPKIFDNTDEQIEKYKERSLQIATEMFYVFTLIEK